MGKLKDSTNILETSISQNANLPINLNSDNYYLKRLQQKVDREWRYRYNVFSIEEENEKIVEYTLNDMIFSPVEVVLQTVYSEIREKLGDDFKKIVFKDLKHPSFMGKRFRFPINFKEIEDLSEEEKRLFNSIWITINHDANNPTNSVLVKRCNNVLGFVGSPNKDYGNIVEYHYEPVILESDLKYVNFYYNKSVIIPQAELYATMQYNYFTQNIKVNDRFLIGNSNVENRENNFAFSVKGISKFFSQVTFQSDVVSNLKNIPLIMLSLDRSTLLAGDNIEKCIAERTTIYTVGNTPILSNEYRIVFEEPHEDIIYNKETNKYVANVYDKTGILSDKIVSFSLELEGTNNSSNYFSYETIDNQISITNLKTYTKGRLILTASWIDDSLQEYSEKIAIELGGWN